MHKPVDSAVSGPGSCQESQAARIGLWARFLIAVLIVSMLGILGRVAQLKVSPDPRLYVAAGTSTSSFNEMARRGDIRSSLSAKVPKWNVPRISFQWSLDLP
ncbi:MAG: hypothetical protein JSV91_10095 [Phycisphaerales bacterium]|nr:MAG: hypothetical protein JSV91_10095 [Phycisphaerales bacterium]